MKKDKEPKGYLAQLERSFREIDKKIDLAYKEVQKNHSEENIRTLNNLRTDKEIIRSRIENLGKTEVVLPEHNISNFLNKII